MFKIDTESTSSTFAQSLQEDEGLNMRFNFVAQRIAADAEELGFVISRDAIMAMPSAVLATYGQSDLSEETYQRELEAQAGYKEAMEAKTLAAKAKDGQKDALAELANLSPAQRMTYARKHGLTGSEMKEDSPAIIEAKRQIMLGIENGAARISYGREHNLI